MEVPAPSRRVHFGTFEIDLTAGELRKQGLKIRLQDRPFQVLAMLLERPGEVVTREDLCRRLWPADTFVDFDVGLNTAIKKLRDALGDIADSPCFVETLPRKGYRFIAPIENGAEERARTAVSPDTPATVGELPTVSATGSVAAASSSSSGRRWRFTVMALASVGALILGLNLGRLRDHFLGNAAEPRIQSLAVLPFDNLTGDRSQDYLVEGMTDALTTELAQIKALRVISRTSAMQYQGTKKPLPQIGRELNVDAIVEGTLRRVGDRVWITSQLIEAASDRHLWAKPYEGHLQELASLQNQVAQDIVREMRIELTPGEHTHLTSARPPANPETLEAYLLGRFFWTKRDARSLKTSIGYYEQALAKDPNYAAAYVGLAEAYEILAFGLAASEGLMPAKEAAVKGRAAVLKALELDDSLAEAHVALGHIHMASGHDTTRAERELQRAIELNPGNADAHHWLAQLLFEQDRHEQALSVIQRAHELDPLSPNILRTQGALLTNLQRYGEAMEAFQKAVALAPNQINVRVSLARHYELRGMYPEALAEHQKINELMKHDPRSRLMVAYLYAMMGRKYEAENTLKQLKERASQDKTSFWFALVTNALGRRDEALSWLERARMEDALQGLAIDNFRFGALRSDPRYRSWLRRVEPPTN